MELGAISQCLEQGRVNVSASPLKLPNFLGFNRNSRLLRQP
ncbi:hypothetical protein D051_0556 [Vibrio parahaemolyticus VPCR-2010]|nr:hypothetical protein D051_0556 [Vibrio parahaemolyticus VPCR-2010]